MKENGVEKKGALHVEDLFYARSFVCVDAALRSPIISRKPY